MPTKVKTKKDTSDPLYGREDLQNCLRAIATHIEQEDFYVRFQQLRQVKKHNLWWCGIQQIFWSEAQNDWRVPTQADLGDLSTREEIKFIYDYVINIFKPHGEAFIAALSADLPGVMFGPEDAMNPDDIRAARLATNKATHIQLYNKAKLLAIHALFLYFCEGFIAAYRSPAKKKEYGEVEIPTYGDPTTIQHPDYYECANCSETTPIDIGLSFCNNCGNPLDTSLPIQGQQEQVPTPGEPITEQVTRQIIEIFGLGNVKVPSYCKSLCDAGYLVKYNDNHYTLFKEEFKDYFLSDDSNQSVGDKIGPGSANSYERYMRSSSVILEGRLYQEISPELITQKCYWVKHHMLNVLGKDFKEECDELREIFPDGIYFSLAEDIFCESKNERIEDYWRVSKAGPSKGLHSDAVGKPLVSINEIRNTLTNLLVQTVEQGIPESFADNKVLDFDAYSDSEASPGMTYPIQVPAGSTASNFFYDRRTATFPKEAISFQATLDADAQFVIGTVPSVYGGEGEGSKTLGEYQQSRSSALQRLSISAAYFSDFWKDIVALCVVESIKVQLVDEKFTRPLSANSFETVWMKNSDTIGKFQLLDIETSNVVPTSWEDKRNLLIQALQLQNPDIMNLLSSADNLGTVLDLFGLGSCIRIPGELQRTKQLEEIVELLNSQPIEIPEIPGLPPSAPQPSVQIEPEVDSDDDHVEVLRNFLVSPQGLDHKQNNPAGYMNCVAHLQAHMNNMRMNPTIMPTPVNPGQRVPGEKQNAPSN